jgi:hypothetical protein
LGTGLNSDNPVPSPARGVVVEAIPAGGGAALATTVTNASGNYGLLVPENSNVFMRARAQMLRTGSTSTWNFQVKNNTNGNALYVLDDSPASVGTGATRNLTATTGWGGADYTGTRAAAPFAILDTVYRAKELIRNVSSASFPPLNLFWSPNNTGAEPFCPSTGRIGTTSYTSGISNPQGCDPVEEGIYVLGNFAAGNGDTDEFDQHVIAHEFGHYVETKFSRSDSIGGQHGDGDKLDLRVAFGEGWGDAFAGMVLNDPVYRDSFGGMSKDFSIDLEGDDTRYGDGGWFSETSVGEILWDLFDDTNESGDTVSLGFQPIFAALVQGQRTTSAFTSVFSFLDALRNVVPGATAGINQLRNGEQISGTDEFGNGEMNNGGDARNLPVYRPITLNSAQQSVCTRATNGEVNKLGNNKFFRLDLASTALVTIRLVAAVDPNTPGSAAAVDPDVYVHRRGEIVARGVSQGPTETISQTSLSAGTYIIEVLDFELASGDPPRCMTVNVTGA